MSDYESMKALLESSKADKDSWGRLLCFVVAMALCGAANAHHPQPAQPQPVIAWQIQYQPVWVPGQYIVAPRPLPVLDWVFGPRVWWTPLPMQQQPITQQVQ